MLNGTGVQPNPPSFPKQSGILAVGITARQKRKKGRAEFDSSFVLGVETVHPTDPIGSYVATTFITFFFFFGLWSKEHVNVFFGHLLNM